MGGLGDEVTLICVPMETLNICFIWIFIQFSNMLLRVPLSCPASICSLYVGRTGQRLSVVTCFNNKVPENWGGGGDKNK